MPTAGTASAVTGVIALVLLTLSVVLGALLSRRPRPASLRGWRGGSPMSRTGMCPC